jgi:acetylxylan esterase
MGGEKRMLRPFSAAVGMLVAGGVLIGTLALGSQPAFAVGPCTDVQIIGLRGSGEEIKPAEHGMGALVGPIADAIAFQVPESKTLSFYGVPYPAVEATIENFLTGIYLTSKEEGSEMLHGYLEEEIAACPSAQLVVIGYSQGAHAAGDLLALEPTEVTDHIGAFVMFGDPRFNPEAPYTVGTFDPSYNGLAGKRPLADFSGWTDRVFSACNLNDVICQGLGPAHDVPSHLPPAYLGTYETVAAGLVRHQLGFPLPPDLPTPLHASLTVASSPSRTGVPVPFSAAGSYYDPGAGGISSYEWDFNGDGVADSVTAGNRTTHVYGSPFSGTASVTVRTEDEQAATATAFVDIHDEASVTTGPPTGPPSNSGNATPPADINTAHGAASAPAIRAPSDSSRPVLSELSVSPRRFRLPNHGAKKSTAVGSWISFRLSEPATVRFTIDRQRSRHRPSRRCAKASSVSHTKANCGRYVSLPGAIVEPGQEGLNKIRFNGRLESRRLASGRYRLSAIAIDPAGNRSRSRRAAFQIVRR